MSYAALVFPDGSRYGFTGSDYAWACRMIVGEIEPYADTWEAYAHLWASTNRFAKLRWLYRTYTDFIRRFSSPIDPTEVQTPRRLAIQSMPLWEVPQGVRERVALFMAGKIGKVVDGVDMTGFAWFGDCEESSSVQHGVPDVRGPSGQCYWRDDATPEFAFGPGRSYLTATVGILGGSLLAGMLAGKLWRPRGYRR